MNIRSLCIYIMEKYLMMICVIYFLFNIIKKFKGGPVGVETIAACISEDSTTIEDVYEPYLLQMGFIERTARGRMVTRLAYEHLNLAMPMSKYNEQSLFGETYETS